MMCGSVEPAGRLVSLVRTRSRGVAVRARSAATCSVVIGRNERAAASAASRTASESHPGDHHADRQVHRVVQHSSAVTSLVSRMKWSPSDFIESTPIPWRTSSGSTCCSKLLKCASMTLSGICTASKGSRVRPRPLTILQVDRRTLVAGEADVPDLACFLRREQRLRGAALGKNPVWVVRRGSPRASASGRCGRSGAASATRRSAGAASLVRPSIFVIRNTLLPVAVRAGPCPCESRSGRRCSPSSCR